MWEIRQERITTIAVVDDEPKSRQSLGWVLTDADLEMAPVEGPLHAVADVFGTVRDLGDALISDHHLRVKSYAQFDGAELVAATIRGGFPAILCTRYFGADIDAIRPFLRYLPVVRRWDELNEPDEVRSALDECIGELSGEIRPQRKTWRTQLVVERAEGDGNIDVSFPFWEIEETVRLRLTDIPPHLAGSMKVGFRVHVMANVGAEAPERLFVEWL